MMDELFVEVVMNAGDFSAAGFEGRDEIEDPLSEILERDERGEVVGGGAGSGFVMIEVELHPVGGIDDELAYLRGVLRQLAVPTTTVLKTYKPEKKSVPVYE